MKHRLAATLMLASMGGLLTVGAAASLSIGADDLGAGGDAVDSCDREVEVDLQQDVNDASLVTAVAVSGISGVVCVGQTLDWQVLGADGTPIRTGASPVTATSLTFPLAPPIPAETIEAVTVTIVG